MGIYFKPLRRKIGVVTLLVACVCLGVLVRSLTFVEEVTVSLTKQSHLKMISGRQSLVLTSEYDSNPGLTWSNLKLNQFPVSRDPIPLENDSHYWRFSILGIRYAKVRYLHGNEPYLHVERHFVVWYWSIVIPLTVLSTWLLLSKPRKRAVAPQTAVTCSPSNLSSA